MDLVADLKFLMFVLTAVLGSVGVSLVDGTGWTWNLAVVVVGAVVLFFKNNTPSQPWAKAGVAVLTAGAAVLVSAWSDKSIDSTELVQILLAVLGALQVAVWKSPQTVTRTTSED